jgi:hypothetical protein
MASLRDTVARLAAGSKGRTEADVQADVRRFLLDAPFELDDDQVIDVALEKQSGGGRRIDVEAGCAVFEVKKSLVSKSVFEAALSQLAGYVRQRTEAQGQRYVGVLTDGQTWVLLHLDPDGHLAESGRLRLRDGGDGRRLAAWLEVVLATVDKVKPTADEIVRRLGADSPAAQLDLADLRALYQSCRTTPEVQLKRELWARLLTSALGTNFDNNDELFVTHTYLVLIAELIAHEVMGLPVDAAAGDTVALLEGHGFAKAGLHGVVEPDFFDWPAAVSDGTPIIAAIARRLSRFDWSKVDRDVLRALYLSVIDPETRRKLGEYYTPDWMAQKMVDAQLLHPTEDRVLDPACGSGTFLFWTVRRVVAACEAANLTNRETVKRVVDHVQGMDLHPVAVTLARVTYLLALTRDRLSDQRDELTVPVFLGDSVRWGHDDVSLGDDGMKVRTSDKFHQLVDDELHFPEAVVEEPARFDRLVADLADRASRRARGSKPPSINGLLNRHKVFGEADREALVTAFQKLCVLHDTSRDHLWSYYIRNRSRPLSFARPSRRADLLVGNPPWLRYRSMPKALQDLYRVRAQERGLWIGGGVATHQDLSDLFVVRSIEEYLKPGGRFAFVMPYAVLSRRQFAGFRSGDWSSAGRGGVARFERPEEFARIKPPPFPVPSCVISGVKGGEPAEIPDRAVIWTGQVSSPHVDWPSAAEHLDSEEGRVATADDVAESPYRSHFRQGAPLVPRVLLKVERVMAGPLGGAAGRTPVRSSRVAVEKPPWRELDGLEGMVESGFVRRVHLGATILAYRSRPAELAIIPWADGRLMDGGDDLLDEFPGLALWWRHAEQLWQHHKAQATRLSLREQIDFQGKIRAQFPIPAHRVVYTRSGQYLAACRIDDPDALIEQTLYWTAVESVDEGRYLSAILNSETLAAAVAPLQSRGQHNPRDFAMTLFALPFPMFDSTNALHVDVARLAERAEGVSAAVEVDESWQFQKARRATREALREDGVADDVDIAVSQLIEDAIAPLEAPDLMGALSDTKQSARRHKRRLLARIQGMPRPVRAVRDATNDEAPQAG